MTSTNGLSCLVVDDEPRLRRVLVQLLDGEGYVCREAGNGKEALALLEQEPVSLLLTDVRMPEMDGMALLRATVQRWPETAVLMVTAVSDVDSAVQCLQMGALDYLGKPFNLDEVRVRVRQAMERRQLQLELKSYQLHLEDRVQAQSRRIEELFLGGVQALAQALEAKDAYLRGHSLRVSSYAEAIAQRLGLSSRDKETMSLGAHLHDIGKIGVSEEVLHKPGRLSDQEYRHIMEHPVIGARILGPLIRDMPEVIAIVRSHHERLDGRGLPDGLRGDQIAMLVRVVSVADAFDAMTSERPYRHSLSVEAALEQLREGRDVQFDPSVVDAFLQAFPNPQRLPIPTPEPALPAALPVR